MKTSWKLVEIRVFGAGNEESIRRRYHAPRGRGFTVKGVDEIVEAVAKEVEQRMPGHEFKLVELAPNRFNFVWQKLREVAA